MIGDADVDLHQQKVESTTSRVAMSVSNDPGHFFQTSASLEKQKTRQLKLKNTNGNPLVLPSKILTFSFNPAESSNGLPILYTGESGGLARRVNLEVLK
jgi:hypothetical protein